MIGNAVPIRYSRRIGRKASLSPIKVSLKKKTRRSAIKKRAPAVNSSLLKAAEKTKVGRKSKPKKNSKQTSGLDSFLPKETEKTGVSRKSKPEKDSKKTSGVKSLLKATEETKVGRNSKSVKNSKQTSTFSKQASPNLKSFTHKGSREDKPNIIDQKRKTRNSLYTSQINLTVNETSLQNLDLSDERKKDIKKKNRSQFAGDKKQPNRKSLRVSKSSFSPKEKEITKKLNDSNVKSSREKRPSRKKSSLQVSSLSAKSVLTPNTGKSTQTSRHSERKKSGRLSTEPLNQEISVYTPTSKSLPVTSNSEKVTRTLRLSENRKSTRSSKGPNRSRILHSEISLCTSAFQTLLETPHPEKRKSSRLLEPSPLRILNKELSLSTPASILRKNPDSMINKSSRSSKSANLPAAESRSRKRGRRKASNKEISTDSGKKLKRNWRQQVDQHTKASENFKMPLSNETENLPLDVLSTPAFVPIHVRTSKSSKRKLHVLATENHVSNEVVQDAKKRKKSEDFPNIPSKGTLKRKRWVLNNLKEKNAGYEDDIFENQNFSLYKTSFHFGDESDGSSVNIATPKFECILTPALPKKTPRFKDCISPTELLQARKTAEEYLYRRNKKRQSGDRPSSSGKKTSTNKKNATSDIPEKKKLDFEEAVNKLIAIQKDLEKDAEIDDEEEDSYFSDASN